MKARRNVRCILCRQLRPEQQSQRATVNNVPTWVCNRCARSPAEASDALFRRMVDQLRED